MSLKHLCLLTALALTLFACGSNENTTETYEVPTQGLITTVTEVQPDEYRIKSEEPVSPVSASRIVVEDMEGNVESYTLDEAKLMAKDSTSVRSRPFRSAGMGYFGYLMIGRMMGGGVRSSAYVNQGAYNQANTRAGSSMRSSARTVSRTKSGFGGGRSTRSFGG